MKNRFILWVYSLAGSLLAFYATTLSSFACGKGCYQPREPECLQDKNQIV